MLHLCLPVGVLPLDAQCTLDTPGTVRRRVTKWRHGVKGVHIHLSRRVYPTRTPSLYRGLLGRWSPSGGLFPKRGHRSTSLPGRVGGPLKPGPLNEEGPSGVLWREGRSDPTHSSRMEVGYRGRDLSWKVEWDKGRRPTPVACRPRCRRTV